MFPICYCPMCCVPAGLTTKSFPPLGPYGCRCGLHLVQTFKTQIDRGGRPPAACPPPSPPNVARRGSHARFRYAPPLLHDTGRTAMYRPFKPPGLSPPRWPQRLLLRFALSADLQGSNGPRRPIPGCVSAAFATNRDMGATRVSGMLLPCGLSVLRLRTRSPPAASSCSHSRLFGPPAPLPGIVTDIRTVVLTFRPPL